MFFVICGLIGVAVGWGVAFYRKRALNDQLHSAAVMGLIFTLLSVVYVVALGWIVIS